MKFKLIFSILFFFLTLEGFSQETIPGKSFTEVYDQVREISNDTLVLKNYIEKFKNDGNSEALSIAYNLQAIKKRNKANYAEAIELHQKAIEISENCNDINFKVLGLNMLGVVYRRIDEIKHAIKLHNQALELLEKSKKKDYNSLKSKAVSLNSLGNIYLTLNEWRQAKISFKEAIEIEKTINNRLGLAINYSNLGAIYEGQDSLKKALSMHLKSLDYNTQINSIKGKIICNNNIGNIYLAMGEPQKALKYVLPNVKKAEDFGDNFYIVTTYLDLAAINLKLKNFPATRTYLKKGIKISKSKNYLKFLANCYKLFAELNSQEGDFKEAFNHLNLFHKYEGQYLNQQNKKYISDLTFKYENDKKKNRIELLEKENELVNLKLSDNYKIAITSGILGFLTLISIFFFYRQHKLKIEKEVIRLEQSLLQSQMNPHFIFNSLNSIKLYIINNEKEKAVFYLNKFSKLIRTILKASKEKEITLEEELKNLELYLNIENIRFENKIKYETTIAPDIDLTSIKIPSLILQPFIENAIWHGLTLKEGEKTIKINIEKINNKQIILEIEDNGIGRKKSAEINAKKMFDKKSLGLELTKKRLFNYFNTLNVNYDIKIVDLKSLTNVASGTKVILTLPSNILT